MRRVALGGFVHLFCPVVQPFLRDFGDALTEIRGQGFLIGASNPSAPEPNQEFLIPESPFGIPTSPMDVRGNVRLRVFRFRKRAQKFVGGVRVEESRAHFIVSDEPCDPAQCLDVRARG